MNYVFLSGEVTTVPSMVSLPTKTPLCVFSIKVEETWVDRSQKKCRRFNNFKIEALGKNASGAYETLTLGSFVNIIGYLRTDKDRTRVRAYTITAHDKDSLAEGYARALDQVIAIMENSDSKDQALNKIEVLRAEVREGN